MSPERARDNSRTSPLPRQDSAGGKPKRLGICKHGEVYMRTLLIQGARSVLRHLEHRPDQADSWLKRLIQTAR